MHVTHKHGVWWRINFFICIHTLFGSLALLAQYPFQVSAPKIHTELIESQAHEYTIHLGGTVDMDNTTTRGYPMYEVAFQPNISLEIENTGQTPVVDPWLVINDSRDWRTIDSMIAEAVRGAATAQDSLFMLYEFARSNRYHDHPVFPSDELHDPVKHFTMYGAGFCDDIGRVTCALAYRAGFTEDRHGGDPLIRSMHGHVMSEVAVNGRYQFIDTDENAFYLDPENERPVSGDEIVRDSDLVTRDYTYGPIFGSWNNSERAPALLGRDDEKGRSITIGYELHLTLRPGEKLTYRWDNIGKTPGTGTLKYYANSSLDYTPPLNEAMLDSVSSVSGVSARDGYLTSAAPNAFVVFEVKSPYVICGGSIKAMFDCDEGQGIVSVGVSADGVRWADVWKGSGTGELPCSVTFDDSLAVKGDIPRYRYLVRIALDSEKPGIRMTALSIHTDLLTSFIGLPRLSLGENHLRYSDGTEKPHRVRITHTYQESGNIMPTDRPALLYPGDGAASRDPWIEFTWQEVLGADRYHLRISRRADLKTSYRPCFDVIIDSTAFVNRRTGLFSPGETYYWSVRARNKEGVWGDWSPVQSFTWSGPCAPVDLGTVSRNGRLFLTWRPNPRGNRPVRYDVYASDIKGFKPSKEPYPVISLGEVPPNFITQTTDTELFIVSPDPSDTTPNRSSYRVIAIDELGTPGGSSWPLELEHPCIYSEPPTEANVGVRFECTVLTLRCLGDLQYRYQEPVYGFWEWEGYEFILTEAPVWLLMNPKTGVMSGVPGPYDIGKAPIFVKVSRTWPYELKTDDFRPESFMKDGPEYQASDEQSFVLTVK